MFGDALGFVVRKMESFPSSSSSCPYPSAAFFVLPRAAWETLSERNDDGEPTGCETPAEDEPCALDDVRAVVGGAVVEGATPNCLRCSCRCMFTSSATERNGRSPPCFSSA